MKKNRYDMSFKKYFGAVLLTLLLLCGCDASGDDTCCEDQAQCYEKCEELANYAKESYNRGSISEREYISTLESVLACESDCREESDQCSNDDDCDDCDDCDDDEDDDDCDCDSCNDDDEKECSLECD